jgi:menaquinone reductase, multiheme cytochrome c subunit
MRAYVFPRWTNAIRPLATLLLAGGLVYVVVLAAEGLSGKTTNVGYQPVQPVPYSHSLHAGDLGIDCRYCHNTVDRAAFAAVPPTQTCMNCHALIRTQSPKLLPVRQSYLAGTSIPWVKVHDLPDFAYFNHSAHVTRGVGCVSCHGRVDKMDTVYQAEPLTMSWCLNCHRHPEQFLRPLDQVTNMNWVPPEDQDTLGRRLCETGGIRPSTDCSTCHR